MQSRRKLGRTVLIFFSCLLTILLAILFVPALGRYRALLVMHAYDKYCERDSVQAATGLTLDLPLREAGYLPVQISFNDHYGMSYYLDRPASFTVDYAIADFPLFAARSDFYDSAHSLYNSYIGAYYLHGYGTDAADEETGLALAAAIANFDQTRLALPALGMDASETSFNILQIEEEEPLDIAGYNWSLYTARLETNGGEHKADKFLMSYLQFGKPPSGSEQYPLRTMYGRYYFTYIEERDLFLGLYAMTRSEEQLDLVDRVILQEMELSFDKP